MSNQYADGRPASQAGGSVRYDAGGRAHVTPSTPEPVSRTRRVASEAESARRAEDALVKAQLTDMSNQVYRLRVAILRIRDIVEVSERSPLTDYEILETIREALK